MAKQENSKSTCAVSQPNATLPLSTTHLPLPSKASNSSTIVSTIRTSLAAKQKKTWFDFGAWSIYRSNSNNNLLKGRPPNRSATTQQDQKTQSGDAAWLSSRPHAGSGASVASQPKFTAMTCEHDTGPAPLERPIL